MKPARCCGQSGFGWFPKQPPLCAWIPRSRSNVLSWRALSAARLRACVRACAPVSSRSSEGLRMRYESVDSLAKRTRIPHACVSLSPAPRAKTDCRFSDFRPVRWVREPCTQRTHLHLTLPRQSAPPTTRNPPTRTVFGATKAGICASVRL